MNVSNLIKKLQEYDPDADVFIVPPFDVYTYEVKDISHTEEEGIVPQKVYIGTDNLDVVFSSEDI